MIPGLEYEPADGGGAASASSSANNDNAYNDNNIQQQYPHHHQRHSHDFSSSPSVQSVELTSPMQHQQHQHSLHRRRIYNQDGTTRTNNGNNNYDADGGYNNDYKCTTKPANSTPLRAVRKLDIFPKAERDYTVRTERGGQLTAFGYVLMSVLIVAEWMTWSGMNGMSLEHIVVDTR